MSDIAIRVENLSKRYRIGLKEEMHDTLAGALTHTLTRPIRNLRRLRRLTTFEDGRGKTATQQTNKPTNQQTNQTTSSGPYATSLSKSNAAKSQATGRRTSLGATAPASPPCFVNFSNRLKILSRVTEPTRGRVELNGRVSSLLEATS